MVPHVFLINHVLKAEFGMKLFLNVFVLLMLYLMVSNVLDAHKDKPSQTEVVSVLKEHFLMELDVKHKQSINVLVLIILIGMELIVYVNVDIVLME